MSAPYWRRTRPAYILGAKRRYWAALGFVVGYQLVFTDVVVRWPL